MASGSNSKTPLYFSPKSNSTSFPYLCMAFDSVSRRSSTNRTGKMNPTSCLLPNSPGVGLVLDDFNKTDSMNLESRSEIFTTFPSNSSVSHYSTPIDHINVNNKNKMTTLEHNTATKHNSNSDRNTNCYMDTTKTLPINIHHPQQYSSSDSIVTEYCRIRNRSREVPNVHHSFDDNKIMNETNSLTMYPTYINRPYSLSANTMTSSSVMSSRNQSHVGLTRIIDKLTRSKSKRSYVSESSTTINNMVSKDYTSDSEKEYSISTRSQTKLR